MVEPVRSKFESVVNPPVAFNVLVKLAALEIVWPLMRPEVIAPRVEFPAVRTVAKRLVELAVVEKKFVVVAEVPVAFTKVKFWRVEEPFNNKLESVANPPVAFNVPVKFAALEIVWPLINPEVMGPAVRIPVVKLVEKRLVEEAVVAKKFVVVALVPVAFTKVKFWRVEEAVANKLPTVIFGVPLSPPAVPVVF